MGNINLVEYTPSYAKAVAEMWVKSSEGWNGDFKDVTEESVLNQMEGSTCINTYLAERNGEILGYCDIMEYIEDEGAIYVKTLNVRYDHHGKGIGRTLVCRALERTIELGWPRLDLYTWPGNTKSIPLYKRCGFFYENRTDATHLMNFIPYAVKTEAVEEFFKEVHLYKDLKREINMEPDGREENGFEFYEYKWEKQGKNLRMEFERTGRGLRLLETEEYLITASLPSPQFMIGKTYKITYEIINKSGKKLYIELKGLNNKNIKYDFQKKIEVEEKTVVEGDFYVGEYDKKITPYITHPTVHTEIWINGKKTDFKLGIVPRCPTKIVLTGIAALPYNCDKECYKNVVSEMYLDIENGFEKEVNFKFDLVNTEKVEFLDGSFDIWMKGKEKKSFKIRYILREYCLYTEDIIINASLEEGENFQFKQTLRAIFKGREGAFGGELEDSYSIVNGAFSVKQSKTNNKVYIREFEEHNEKIFINIPKLGEPFTNEFSNIGAKEVCWYKEGEYMVLKSTFESKHFPNIEVSTVIKLSQSGRVEHYHEVYNASENQSFRNISIAQGVSCYLLSNGVVPMDNKIIEIGNIDCEKTQSFNLDRITENWIFSKTSSITKGLYWREGLKPKVNEQFICFKHNLGTIKPKETVKIDSIVVWMNGFQNWQQFRDFVRCERNSAEINTVEDLEISVNKGNPFVQEQFKIRVKEHKQSTLNGEVTVCFGKESVDSYSKTVKVEGEMNAEMMIDSKGQESLQILNLQADLSGTYSEKRSAIFMMNHTEMKKEIVTEKGQSVYSLDNGVIKIKVAPSFSPAVYSINYKNAEWLESSFPTPRIKSWFNPWIGGILNAPSDFGARGILEEEIEADFIKIKDSLNNEWSGIKSRCSIKKNSQYRGLTLNGYFLMLPGVPVLCHTTEILQETGSFLNREEMTSTNFFFLDEKIKNNYFMIQNRQHEFVKYKCGEEDIEFCPEGTLLVGSRNRKEKLQLFTKFERVKPMLMTNINDTACFIYEHITVPNGKRIFTTPVFYIFTEEFIEEKLLKDLRNVKFE